MNKTQLTPTQRLVDAALRHTEVDALKGLAVLWMIQVHVVSLFARQELMDGWVGQVSLLLGGAPVAPLFMVVLGYYALRQPHYPGRVLLRAMGLLALGAVLNLGLNAHLLWRIGQGTVALSPWPYLLGVDIFWLAGLSLVAIVWLRPLLQHHAWAWGLASVAVAALSPQLTQALQTEGWAQWPLALVASQASWSFFPLFPWLAYPLLGVALAQVPASWAHTRWRLWALAGVPVLLWGGPWAMGVSHQLPLYYHHGLGFYGWTVLLLLALLAWVPGLLGPRLGGWLAWFGQHVTAVYVVQWLLIGNLATALYKTQSLPATVAWVVAMVWATRWGVAVWLRWRQAAGQPM